MDDAFRQQKKTLHFNEITILGHLLQFAGNSHILTADYVQVSSELVIKNGITDINIMVKDPHKVNFDTRNIRKKNMN